MTTVQNVFDYTMSIIGQRLETGLVDATSTAVYVKNTPYILTMLQYELIPKSDYFKTETITVTSAVDTAGHYIAHTMPADFYSASQIIEIEQDGTYQKATDFRWEGNNVLLIPDTFIGTYKIKYRPIPSPLTAMTDELVLDDITCRTTLVNGLASRLLTNENRTLANYFGQIYDELKNKPKTKQPAGISPIKDVYDSKLTY